MRNAHHDGEEEKSGSSRDISRERPVYKRHISQLQWVPQGNKTLLQYTVHNVDNFIIFRNEDIYVYIPIIKCRN